MNSKVMIDAAFQMPKADCGKTDTPCEVATTLAVMAPPVPTWRMLVTLVTWPFWFTLPVLVIVTLPLTAKFTAAVLPVLGLGRLTPTLDAGPANSLGKLNTGENKKLSSRLSPSLKFAGIKDATAEYFDSAKCRQRNSTASTQAPSPKRQPSVMPNPG